MTSAASEEKMDLEANAMEIRKARESSSIFPPNRGDSIQELAFLDLKYEVENIRPGMEAETLKVLEGVSGQANSGEMLALMGPSGSGKTSLLNVLAQRVPHKSVTGGVFVDGSPLSKSFKRRMGFVFQDDMCLWNLTVRETVMFAAKLRLPQSTPDKEKHERVAELLELLGLSHVADGIIGKEGRRGISGGERKRVSIGVELITSPDVLFLDEPTSGLDSSTALSITHVLRTLTRKGMIVVCSIHQPRSNIFSEFDKVLLLSKGNTVYYGSRSSIVKYFEALGLELPPETNSADWILDLTTSSTIVQGGKTLTQAYQQRTIGPLSSDMAVPTASTVTKTRDRLKGSGSDKSEWVTSFGYQLKVLLQRQSRQSRGEVFNSVNLTQIFVVAMMASAIWWQSENVSDIAGTMFFISIQQAFNGLNTSMRVFPPERGLMIRERSTGSYRVGPYFLAKSTSDIGLYTAAPILYATAVYWCVGLRPEAGAFFTFLLLFMGQVIVGQSIGLLISTSIADIFTAQSFSFVLILSLMLFGGFYVNNNNVPEGLGWLKYLSFLFYGFGGLLHNEFHGREYSCENATGKGLSGLDACAANGSGTVTGQDILDEFGFSDVNVWQNVGILAAMIVGMRFLTYLLMRRFTKTRT
ncbi:ABC [Ectocarpus sp. CCAP 1310/34]|nr:ABC [Ectocarpus sp. CCAP 1310/34]